MSQISPVIVDIYALDDGGHPTVSALVNAGMPWAGLTLKVSEGTYYPSLKQSAWIKTYWPLTRTLAERAHRYGQNFFRGAYHYFRVQESALEQVELFLKTIDDAGGWGPGDLLPMVDLESSENPPVIAPQLVIDQVSKFSELMEQLHGRRPILYAGSYVRDLGIKSHMGASYLWTAAYGSTLPAHLYLDMGWRLDELLAWQMQGTEFYSGPAGYPRQCPIGPGPNDLSAITIDNGATPDEQLQWMRDNLLGA